MEHDARSLQRLSFTQAAVFSVVVTQKLNESGPPQPHVPIAPQLPPEEHVWHVPPACPVGVRQHAAGGELAPHGPRQTGSPQQVVLLQMYPAGQSLCPFGHVSRESQQTFMSTQYDCVPSSLLLVYCVAQPQPLPGPPQADSGAPPQR